MSLAVYEIPSKCRFDLIQVTLEHVRDERSAKELGDATGQHIRHAYLLLQNADILGFIRREGSGWILTETGRIFLEAQIPMKGVLLAKAMLESHLITFVLSHAGSLDAAKDLTLEEISDLLLGSTIISKGSIESIKRTTAVRRAASVKAWIDWLAHNVPRMCDEPEDVLALAEQETLDFYD